MTQTFIIDKDGLKVDAAEVTLPSNRFFRNAWALSEAVITEDLDAAKDLFREQIRLARKPLLEAEDVVFMKALESGDSTAQASSATKKQQLRDAPASSAISNATSISQLKAAWDSDLLGDSPYAG